jgi:glycosyltransferase involved in cell wall biosynthesis
VRILWVKAGKLLPVDTGGKIRSFNLLRHLDRDHELTLLSYYGGGRDHEYERHLAATFTGGTAIHTGALDGSRLSQAIDYAWRAVSPAPYAVAKFTSPRVRRQVLEWDRAGRFDIAVCDFLSASLNFPSRPNTPTVLFQHNVESVLWARQAATEPHPLKRVLFAREARKMKRYERQTVARFNHVIAVSEEDRQSMAAMTTAARIAVIPTGVDTQLFRPTARNGSPEREVLFLGSMDWEPNIDAVQFFCDRIWPLIRAAVPDARFRIVGRNPAPAVRRLASDSIEVVGRVPSVTEYLHRAAVVVVPLRAGGGTRLKIYEAMAAAKAVVSTQVGAEGLDVDHGRNIVLADTPPAFAEAVSRLLTDGTERQHIEDGALALASRYDWSAVAQQFGLTLEHVVAETTAGRSARAVA